MFKFRHIVFYQVFLLFIFDLDSKLRPRPLKVFERTVKKTNKSRALVRSKTISKPKACESVINHEVVLVKIKGFCEWPAIVTGIENKLISIKFFGDQTTRKISLKNVFKFEDSHETILNNLRMKKTPLYAKSVQEAEKMLGVPPEKPILNQCSQ